MENKEPLNSVNALEKLIETLKTDLISPLEVIRTTCELLLKGVTGMLLPEQQDFITRISKQSKKSLALIHDLVDMHKIETGFELNFVNLKIKDVLDNIIDSFKKNLKTKKIKLTFDENFPNFPFLGDIARIEKIFKNLMTLCVSEAEESSEIKIRITPLKGHRKTDHNRLIYKISFTFSGTTPLTDQEEKALFDTSLEQINKPHYLKLPTSKYIMLLHKGSLTYEKMEKNLSQYSVILPSNIATQNDNTKDSLRILIIGENTFDNETLCSMLEKFSITSIAESSTQRAFNILRKKNINLVIFDYNPESKEFNKFLKDFDSSNDFHGIPLILYSRKEHQKSITKIERFFSDTLTKPASIEDIQTKLENFLNSPITPFSETSKNNKMLLIVDDNKEARELFKDFLSESYNLISCKNGNEALFFLKKYNFDCAIFNAEMPGMDGIELITNMRQFNTSTAVIFATEHHNDIYQRGASIFGVSRVLKKPFTKNELIQTIEETINSKL